MTESKRPSAAPAAAEPASAELAAAAPAAAEPVAAPASAEPVSAEPVAAPVAAPASAEPVAAPASPAKPAAAHASPAEPVPAHALLVGWMIVALVDAVASVALLPSAGAGRRAGQVAFTAGYDLFVGLVASAAVGAWHRWAPRSPRIRRPLAVLLPAVLVGAILARDLESFAEGLPGPTEPWMALLALVMGATVPAAAIVAAFLVRRRLGIAALAVGLVGAGANHLVLSTGYTGVHFAAAMSGAILTGSGVVALLPPLPRLPARGLVALRAALAVAGAFAVVHAPGMTMMVELLRLSGHAPARLIGEARRRLDPGWTGAAATRDLGEWFVDRSRRSKIDPSGALKLPRDPVFVLVTVDALRADVFNSGEHDDQFPALKKLRESAVVFTHARSAASATAPSIAALFSGKYYSQLYWSQPKKKIMSRDGSSKVFLADDKSVRFTSVMTDAGVKTVNIAGTGGFTKAYGLVSGFSEDEKPGSKAKQLVDAAIARIKAADGPMFLYFHCMEPHEGYDAPGATPFKRYLGEVEKVDKALRPLVDLMDDPAYRDRLVIILSADHGEAFGEHGTKYHGTTVYEELVRVPLAIHVPKVAARTEATPVSTIDVGPTVLDLLGLATPGTHMGQSLAPIIAGKPGALTRPIVIDTGRRIQAMIEGDRYKIIRDLRQGTVELYDLANDPDELKNLSDDDPTRTSDLLGRLTTFFDVHTFRKAGYEVPYRQ